MSALLLTEELMERIRVHGAETYPHECCGALLGRDDGAQREILDLLPLANQHARSPRNRFVITAEDFRRAEAAARESGVELLGWYHSHPDHPAIPSEFDREHAWPWYSYVIVAVEKGRPRAIAAWRLADNRMRFTPELVSNGATASVRA